MTRRDEFSAACTLTHFGRPDVIIINGSPLTKPMIAISAMVKDREAILVIAFCYVLFVFARRKDYHSFSLLLDLEPAGLPAAIAAPPWCIPRKVRKTYIGQT